ncbi:hypothetical protein [Streptomyces daqingensis]|uniref:hypothetical protein n=1 Tax=Streptomyces daqingensis TaxID=1472640 RepID=UPI001E436FB6|nr:hypothetical protein [Streptomyces daqingensis]
MRRLLRGRRRATAAGLAVAAAALAASAARGQGPAGASHPDDLASTRSATSGRTAPEAGSAADSAAGEGSSSGEGDDRAGASDPGQRPTSVSAPVRIADAAAVRLLRPGDRVDVIASQEGSAPPRTVATGARVERLPKHVETDPVDGALVVLAVPRRTATALAGAAVTSRLAVTLR